MLRLIHTSADSRIEGCNSYLCIDAVHRGIGKPLRLAFRKNFDLLLTIDQQDQIPIDFLIQRLK